MLATAPEIWAVILLGWLMTSVVANPLGEMEIDDYTLNLAPRKGPKHDHSHEKDDKDHKHDHSDEKDDKDNKHDHNDKIDDKGDKHDHSHEEDDDDHKHNHSHEEDDDDHKHDHSHEEDDDDHKHNQSHEEDDNNHKHNHSHEEDDDDLKQDHSHEEDDDNHKHDHSHEEDDNDHKHDHSHKEDDDDPKHDHHDHDHGHGHDHDHDHDHYHHHHHHYHHDHHNHAHSSDDKKFNTCRKLMCGTLPSNFKKHMKECALEMNIVLPVIEHHHEDHDHEEHHQHHHHVSECGRPFRPNHPSQNATMQMLSPYVVPALRKCILTKNGILNSWDNQVNRCVLMSMLYPSFLSYPELVDPIKEAIETTCQEPVEYEIQDFFLCVHKTCIDNIVL